MKMKPERRADEGRNKLSTSPKCAISDEKQGDGTMNNRSHQKTFDNKAVYQAAHKAVSSLTPVKVFFSELQEKETEDEQLRFIAAALPVCLNAFSDIEERLKEILLMTSEEG